MYTLWFNLRLRNKEGKIFALEVDDVAKGWSELGAAVVDIHRNCRKVLDLRH